MGRRGAERAGAAELTWPRALWEGTRAGLLFGSSAHELLNIEMFSYQVIMRDTYLPNGATWQQRQRRVTRLVCRMARLR